MKRFAAIVLFSAAILLSACASTLNVLDNVRMGQNEAQGKGSVRDTPAWEIGNEKTKYIIYGYIATFLDMYDNTVTYYFVKLENDKVVDKGMVGKRERNEIKIIDPGFDTDKLIRRPHNRAN